MYLIELLLLAPNFVRKFIVLSRLSLLFGFAFNSNLALSQVQRSGEDMHIFLFFLFFIMDLVLRYFRLLRELLLRMIHTQSRRFECCFFLNLIFHRSFRRVFALFAGLFIVLTMSGKSCRFTFFFILIFSLSTSLLDRELTIGVLFAVSPYALSTVDVDEILA